MRQITKDILFCIELVLFFVFFFAAVGFVVWFISLILRALLKYLGS